MRTPKFLKLPAILSIRFSFGKVSPQKSEDSVRRTPETASRTNTPRHDIQSNICPPMTGASIGASPFTSIKREKNFVSSTPS